MNLKKNFEAKFSKSKPSQYYKEDYISTLK